MEATKPTKEDVRSWLAERQAQHAPPPTPENIRRELGWQLIPHNTHR